MSNKYDYLDEYDDYFDGISDWRIRQGVALANSDKLKSSSLEAAKVRSKTEDWLKKNSEKAKKQWANPEVKAKQIAAHNTPEAIKNKKESMKGKRNGFKGAFIGKCIKTGKMIKLSSQKECEDAGFNYYAINQCVRGRLKTSGGYTWRRESVK
jgi:hypothetical protein